jgi:hypothetical protein
MVGTHAGDMIGEIALAVEMGADAVIFAMCDWLDFMRLASSVWDSACCTRDCFAACASDRRISIKALSSTLSCKKSAASPICQSVPCKASQVASALEMRFLLRMQRT